MLLSGVFSVFMNDITLVAILVKLISVYVTFISCDHWH